MDISPAQHRITGPTGLLLTGGGARAAYQIGVLRAIAALARECGAPASSPFQVIAGTSAGAINASALACQADRFQSAVADMAEVWRHFRAEQVYRADSLGVMRTGARWLTMMSFGWMLARVRRIKPRSLLDNSPLESLLQRMVAFDRLPALMAQGHLQALAVTASSYTTGHHVTFYESLHEPTRWQRSQRIAVRSRLGVHHLLASAAIPFIFPSVSLEVGGEPEWFGDGSMRQAAPISPAVHLGAERILIIGAGRMHEPPGHRLTSGHYPSVAQIAGHAMSSIFLDALAVDIERLERINATLSLLPHEALGRTSLKPIRALVIAPSQRLDDLAARHLDSLPAPIRALLRAVGVSGQGSTATGAALASYLLFEAPYTQALMALGENDTLARRDEVIDFFGWQVPAAQAAALHHRAGAHLAADGSALALRADLSPAAALPSTGAGAAVPP
ncbi:NTE family protein [Sphaerotilus hippei]|uniref:NTE family protein n=1 Tax=Sphaerotilus hippei TaxID=744406 RepID=A0A318H5P4_9BURK|nr:patatin-like phospholipase family protein [Sphaerotilus hippei]PXW92265.1 NTE family protein [Sphaerotilus hippei]